MKKPIPDPQQDFELIGRFHNFELSETELQEFEERMENDPTLQERFRQYGEMEQHIDRVLVREEVNQVANDFTAVLRNDKKQTAAKVRSIFSRQTLRIAASIALLLVAGLWWMLRPEVLDSNLALGNYYWEATDKTHLFESSQRGDNNQDPNESARTFFRSLQEFQEKGEYGTLVDQLEIYLATTPAPIPFQDDADWLLAIGYVANNDLENAKLKLGAIISAYPARQARARVMLEDIGKMELAGEVKK